MEEAFVNRLLAASALADLVENRITWNERPQAEGLPAISLHMISRPQDYTYEGRVGLIARLVQIDCWASTPLETWQVARAVIAALDELVAAPFAGAFLEGERQDFSPGDAPIGDAANAFHRTSLDCRVWHHDSL